VVAAPRFSNLVVAQDVNHQAGQPCRYPACLLVVGLACELRLPYRLVMECKDHHRQETNWEIDGSLKKSDFFIGELLVIVVVVVVVISRTLILLLLLLVFVCIFVLEKFSTYLLISHFI
jgi:hypothetical protein